MARSPFPNDVNQENGFDDNQDSITDNAQASPEDFEGIAINSVQKLIITARLGKTGYEATVLNMPDVKKKTSKVSLEQAARELVNSMKLLWDDFKEATSIRDQQSGRKQYVYQGEPF
jgi:hypothetical protein